MRYSISRSVPPCATATSPSTRSRLVRTSTFHPREVELLMHDHGIGERLELVVLRRDGREVNASVEVMERKREDE